MKDFLVPRDRVAAISYSVLAGKIYFEAEDFSVCFIQRLAFVARKR
jgi:hypothetical protein